MKEEINRLAGDLGRWNKREERFKMLFPNQLHSNRPFLEEKLNYIERLKARYRSDLNADEKLSLKILEQERRDIYKRLYPNVLVRLFMAIGNQVFANRQEKRAEQARSENLNDIKEVLRKAGFTQIGNKLEEQIAKNANSFTIPVSHYINDHEKMNFDVSFSRDVSGKCHLVGYAATLRDEKRPSEVRGHNFIFENNTLVTTEQAHDLLSGRAMVKAGTSNDWMQFDLNDRDAKGNYRLKEYSSDFNFDIGEALKGLPIKDLKKDELVAKLSQGNRVEIVIKNANVERTLFIEANPQYRSLRIFDGLGRSIKLDTALGNVTVQNIKRQQPVAVSKQRSRKKS